MRLRALPFLTAVALVTSYALAATIDVAPGASIQNAIDSAAAGDTISIAPGTYGEAITLKAGVTLAGKSRNEVVIEVPPAAGNVLLIKDCGSGEVRSLTIRHATPAEDDKNGTAKAAVRIADSSAALVDCTIEASAANGIRIEGTGNPRVESCTIQHCSDSGVLLLGSAGKPELLKNSILDNANTGVILHDCKTAKVSGNVIKGNRYYGIWIDDKSALDGSDNDFTDNAQIGAYEIRTLRNAKQFAKLETIAERLRRDKSRYPSGGWQLAWFYQFLAEGFRGYGPAEIKPAEDYIAEWKKAYPDSLTWRIPLIDLYRAQAWKARGGGYASTVSAAAWKGYQTYMEKAWTAMDDAAKLKQRDPEYFVRLCEMSLELPRDAGGPGGLSGLVLEVLKEFAGSETKSASDVAFEEGIKLDPHYGPLYFDRVRGLLPRWGGSQREMMAFADKTAKDLGGDDGDAYYALIATEVKIWEGDDVYRSGYIFSWERLQSGYEALLKQFPESDHYRNAYARMACVEKDASVANRMFKQIKGLDSAYWANSQEFETYKAWALGSGKLPERSQLEMAVENHDTEAVRTLLASGADAKTVTAKGEPLLEIAIRNDDFATAQALADAGADVNAKDSRGEPLIRLGLAESQPWVLNFFITNNADLNAVDAKGWSPMADAIVWGRPHLARLLLESGADPNGKSLHTPLQVAVQRRTPELVPILIEHKADVNFSSGKGDTPLEIAVRLDDVASCRVLLEHGANPNVVNKNEWTPLEEAVDHGSMALTRLLVEHGADVYKREPDGWDAFHMAVMSGHKDILEYLLEKSPEGLHSMPDTKYTLLHTAAKNGRTDLVTFLIGKGLDVNARGADGKTALALAIEGKHDKVAKILRESGATE